MTDHHSGRWVGLAAALTALLIGAGWQIATRWGVTTSLQPVDLALLRYGVPGLVLLPVALRFGLIPAGVKPILLATILIGGGLPFGLLCIGGSAFAPVAHMGVLVPGGIALMVAVLSWAVMKQSLSPLRMVGLAALTAGLLLLAASTVRSLDTGMLRGHAMFLAAACLWVAYTLAFRRSGLQPLHATALIGVCSLLVVVPVWLLTPGTRLLAAPWSDVLTQIVWQGVLAGVVAVIAYGVAVRDIGAPMTTAIGALLPAMVAVGGAVFLGEDLSMGVVAAVALTVIGVFFLTGWWEQRRQTSSPAAG
jgi:drug/metabolite transporter (DMT)-like permease